MWIGELEHIICGKAAGAVDLDHAEARVGVWGCEGWCGFGVVGGKVFIGHEGGFAFLVVFGDYAADWGVHFGNGNGWRIGNLFEVF